MMGNDDRDRNKDEQAGKTPNRAGFWGRGESDRDFANSNAREHSREDYGTTDHGGEEEPSPPDAGERNPVPGSRQEPGASERKPTVR